VTALPEVAFPEVAEHVRALIAEHAQAQDDGRVDDIAALYCPDGAFVVPGMGRYEGRETIRETWAAWAAATPEGRLQRHVVTNTVITEWDAEQARASSDAILLSKGEAGWAIGVVARYHDTFRRTAEGWRIALRDEEFFGWAPPSAG
jgi:uncharacterized protein (TIGR02246 family)